MKQTEQYIQNMIFNIEERTETMRNYEFSTQGTVRVVTFALMSFQY